MFVIVLGASGMLGNVMLRELNQQSNWEVFGTIRSASLTSYFSNDLSSRLISGIDVENHDALLGLFAKLKPDVVVNCVGIVKQLTAAESPITAIPINSLLPHRLAVLCRIAGTRLVHISTDCVFSGEQGNYREDDPSDAKNIYGKTKFLGEVLESHTITLRTSIIGHELHSNHGLVEWFLSQVGRCKGYTRAIFSGLPAVVLAGIVRDIIIPRPELSGLYHIAGQPISKYELLKLIANVYGKDIEIIPSDQLVVDRSLNADRFRDATGYVAPNWPELIELMHKSKNM